MKNIKGKTDFIIFSVHWGYEHTLYPSPQQIQIAHNLIDMGIDVIIGHHPHFVQGYEEYNDGLIFYSLGNFNFSQFDVGNKKYDQLSVVLELKLNEGGEINFSLLPVHINENYLPEPLKGKKRNEFMEHLNCISKTITEDKFTHWFWLRNYCEDYLKDNLISWKKRIKKHGLREFLKASIWSIRPFNLACYICLLIYNILGFIRSE